MIARAPSMQLPSAASSPAASVRRCKRVGHSVSAETMCFDRWCDTASSSTSTSNALPAPHPATAAAVKEVLDDPPELVRRLSFLCKEVKLVNEQLAFVKSKQKEHVEEVADQLSQVRARQDDQSARHEAQRVVNLEQRFEGFDDSLKDALVRKAYLADSGASSCNSNRLYTGSTGPGLQGSGVQDERASRHCSGQ